MNLENVEGEGLPAKLDHDELRQSFHGQLLDRARTNPTQPPKQVPFSRFVPRGAWIVQLVQVVGDGSIFAGGLAIGGGMMLLRRGEPLKGLPGGMLAFGVAFVLTSIIVKVVSKEQGKSWSAAARG